MVQVYVGAVRVTSKQKQCKNILFSPDRTKRKRTPLHELVLSKHCTLDILMYWLQSGSTDERSGWWYFIYQKDGHEDIPRLKVVYAERCSSKSECPENAFEE